MPWACCIRPYPYAYPVILYSLPDPELLLPCVGPTFVGRRADSTQPIVDAASASTNAASLVLIESAFVDHRSFPSNGRAEPYYGQALIGKSPILHKIYSIFCIEVMSREILYVIQLLLSLQFPLQSLPITLLFKLLEIGLLIRYFHIPQTLAFLLLQLASILIYLQCLLIELFLLLPIHLLTL